MAKYQSRSLITAPNFNSLSDFHAPWSTGEPHQREKENINLIKHQVRNMAGCRRHATPPDLRNMLPANVDVRALIPRLSDRT